jgi:hypothetical protein
MGDGNKKACTELTGTGPITTVTDFDEKEDMRSIFNTQPPRIRFRRFLREL